MESHLLQMRGLKQYESAIRSALSVASFTDAWIETLMPILGKLAILSHLLQMRGLKPARLLRIYALARSHLLQMRGLKHPFEHGYKQNQ